VWGVESTKEVKEGGWGEKHNRRGGRLGGWVGGEGERIR